jgi:general secretion pathway protein E
MVADQKVQSLIHNRAAESDLFVAAQAAGLRSMREDGERLVAEGVTSLEELVRVTRESDLPGSEAANRRAAARSAI